MLDRERRHDAVKRGECQDQIVVPKHEADAVASEASDVNVAKTNGLLTPFDE